MRDLYLLTLIADSIRLDQTAMTPEVNGTDVVIPDVVNEEAMEEAEGMTSYLYRLISYHYFHFRRSKV